MGVSYYDSHTVTDSAGTNEMVVNLPGDAGKDLSDADIRFQEDSDVDPTYWDAACSGTAKAPTASVGKVCVYVSSVGGVTPGTIRGGAALLPRLSFYVDWQPTTAAVVDEYLYVSWAYTAP